MAKNFLKACSALSLLALSACGPIVSFGSDEPASIYSLDYRGPARNDAAGPVLYVSEPVMTQDLGTRRVAVQLGGFERTFLKEARWATALGDMVRGYMVEAITGATSAQALGEGALDVASNCRVGLTVRAFDYVPRSDASSDDTVLVRIEMSFVRLTDSKLLGRRDFSASQTVAGTDRHDIVASFNAAMAAAGSDMTDWLAPQLGNCPAS
ncbi:hypothetical protein GCM10017044_02090 [Kordiimonas sediminis]|uniref:ABC-type transport auxiliary lipoprotein component domain-containing protein n=1 Tax=Kordiimonas sediminis TaxID=1735581 RepID=A0A919AIS8_9PROT|nr:ABC-type transport auxiliary lipoprotein family protein [Kordiimonas sediminis]GHF11824.1 hypothetical protein GCM10017044_02090 [Kordiimonas sediminis]